MIASGIVFFSDCPDRGLYFISDCGTTGLFFPDNRRGVLLDTER